ncbi:OB-fold domain-containing protein [Thermodesulfobacteriota bacterium]
MIGITSYGAYIPRYRLDRNSIAELWGRRGKGEKAVANFDEDSITMAVAAARDCIKGLESKSLDGLYFASTTSPYNEKQAAATVATAVDLRRDITTMDFGSSLRAGANAMKAAIDSINSNSAKSILVCASDMRIGAPNGSNETDFGDGAGALLFGNTNVLASVVGAYSITDEIIDAWRAKEDLFVRTWEDRFAKDYGFTRVTTEAVTEAMKEFDITPNDISKFACYTPTARDVFRLAKNLGFDPKTQIQDSMYDSIGNTGTPLAIMVLVSALEEAKSGDRILFASYGDGCTVFLFEVTKEIENFKTRRGIKHHLASKANLPSYQKYLQWRGVIPVEQLQRPNLDRPSAVALWRNRKSGLALFGSRCKNCKTIQYPPQRVCLKCQTKDLFDEYCFAGLKGSLVTFSIDTLAATEAPPTIICVVDFPEGGRILCDMTDCDINEIKIGMPVEMTFRRLRRVEGICNYFWKCQPLKSNE